MSGGYERQQGAFGLCPVCNKLPEIYGTDGNGCVVAWHVCEGPPRPIVDEGVSGVCVECGGAFSYPARQGARHICFDPECRKSRNRRRVARQRLPEKPCDACGEKFQPKSCRGRFCSHACAKSRYNSPRPRPRKEKKLVVVLTPEQRRERHRLYHQRYREQNMARLREYWRNRPDRKRRAG